MKEGLKFGNKEVFMIMELCIKKAFQNMNALDEIVANDGVMYGDCRIWR